MDYINILDVKINNISKQEAAKLFINFTKANKQNIVVTPNAEILLQAQKNLQLKKILQTSNLNLPDSVSLLWAGMVVQNNWSLLRSIFELIFLPLRKFFWKNTFQEQICGSDFIYNICDLAQKNKKKIFLLGAQNNIANKTKLILEKKFPNLKIVGAIAGSPYTKDDHWVIDKINESSASILLVAYGCPKQEFWIQRNLEKCSFLKVAIGLGGTFDFIAGNIPRAPLFLRKIGLEWLFRLVKEPRRFIRIWQAVIIFPYTFLHWHFSR